MFQDPHSSLDPMMTVGTILAEPLEVHTTSTRAEVGARVAELLELVGLGPATARQLPDALSGGQRQRVAIARALALRPRLIVCDEPVSSLDVSTQAQVINLLVDLRRELGVAYLFIGHDLAVVRHISDRVAAMRHGRIVEMGTSDQIHRRPRHAYTRALNEADGESVVLHLRDDVTCQDGTPFDAEAVAFNLDRARNDPDSNITGCWRRSRASRWSTTARSSSNWPSRGRWRSCSCWPTGRA